MIAHLPHDRPQAVRNKKKEEEEDGIKCLHLHTNKIHPTPLTPFFYLPLPPYTPTHPQRFSARPAWTTRWTCGPPAHALPRTSRPLPHAAAPALWMPHTATLWVTRRSGRRRRLGRSPRTMTGAMRCWVMICCLSSRRRGVEWR